MGRKFQLKIDPTGLQLLKGCILQPHVFKPARGEIIKLFLKDAFCIKNSLFLNPKNIF